MNILKTLWLLLLEVSLAVSSPAYAGYISYDFGNVAPYFSRNYGFIPTSNEYYRNISFSVPVATLLKITYSQEDTSGSLVRLEDGSGNVLGSAMTSSAGTALGTCSFVMAVPVGSYMIYMDFKANKPCHLQLEGETITLESFAAEWGSFDKSFALSKTVDLCKDGSTFIGSSTWNGMGCARIELTKRMNLSMSCHTSVRNGKSRLVVLDNNEQTLFDEEKSGSVSSELTQCALGTYYILFSSSPLSQVGVYLKGTTLTDAVPMEDNDKSTNHIVHRTYTNSRGTVWRDETIYYDEMGREQERVKTNASPDLQNDLVDLAEYDSFGRLDKQWLTTAVPGNNGAFVPPISLRPLSSASNIGDAKPYACTIYESSPTSRVLEQYGAGEAWHDKGKSIKTYYCLNRKNFRELSCRHYVVSGKAGSMKVEDVGQYPDGSLNVTRITDEDGNASYVFKDDNGLTVLSRQVLQEQLVDTYNIYDEWGHLRMVLPPLAASEIQMTGKVLDENSEALSCYAYLYDYDGQYRQIGKKLPGCDWTYVVYDKSDTPILTQNGEQRQRGEWSFVIPDVWGRSCLEGVCKNGISYGDMLTDCVLANYVGKPGVYGYQTKGLELVSPIYNKVSYYDSYTFMSDGLVSKNDFSYDYSLLSPMESYVVSAAKGKLTGNVSAVDGDMSKSIKSVSYYNRLGMLLQQHTTNIRSGKDIVACSYDFMGNCIKKKQIHSSEGNKTHTLEFTYTYDRQGRLLTADVSYDDEMPVMVNAYKYDEVGRLVANDRNGMEALRTIYNYDVRSHLTEISSEDFSQKIHYADASNGSTPCYNGNISAMEWSIGYNGTKHGYTYKYDELSRLVSANYCKNGKKTGDYSTSYAYDLMGNVLSLTRKGLLDDRSYGLVDNLSYEYHGNQVTRVTDAVSGPYYKNAMHFVDGADEKVEYEYNENGAMTKNLNKGIELIEYNQLNLPTKVLFSDGSTIVNIYDADGNKLRTSYHVKLASAVSSSSNVSSVAKYIDYRRDYCGDVEYRDDELSCWRYDGGHLEFAENDSAVYLYDLKDNQGNVRVSATGDEDNVVTTANHYYPFGSLMGCSQVGAYQYRYNDKSLELTHGLNWYDYGARKYDGMRFTTPDPHAEAYTPFSPYAYCLNNPIRLIDKDGNDPGDFFLTMDEAAMDFGFIYNGQSILKNVEISSSIVAVSDENGNCGYTYFMPIEYLESESKANIQLNGHNVVATIHTHGAYNEIDGLNTCDYFSGKVAYNRYNKLVFTQDNMLKSLRYVRSNPSDIASANKFRKVIYLATPSGSLQKYNPKNGKINNVTTKLPSDKNDPFRLNNVSPYVFSKNVDSAKCMNNIFQLLLNPFKLQRK